ITRALRGDRRLDFLEEVRREHAPRERLERHGVAGIAHDPQGGDHVLDDVVLDQRAAARQPAGNPRPDEPSLEVLADLVPAVEHRVVAPSQADAAWSPRMSSSSQEASSSSSRKANAPTSYGDSCSALSCFSNSWGFCASTRRAVSKIWREQRQFLSSTMGWSIS